MAPSLAELKARWRHSYPYLLDYRTRWNDNDMYAHMNNSVYNFLFDSVLNSYLVNHCGLNPSTPPQHGLVVHSHTDYFASVSYPAVAELGLCVRKLGRTSITYEMGLFEQGVDEVKSVGVIVQVIVDRETGKSAGAGIPKELRIGLQRLLSRSAKGGDAGEDGKTGGSKDIAKL